MQLLKKLSRRQASPQSPTLPRRCFLLEGPVEIRFTIYEWIATRSFLPQQHYREYIGLFLSCKQICVEMQQECLRSTTGILEAVQGYIEVDSRVKLRPIRPLDFRSLNHLTIGVPHWALFSPDIQNYVLGAMMTVVQMHLSTLTIGLEDIEDGMDVTTLARCLRPQEIIKFMDASDFVRNGENEDKEDYYNTQTTCAPVAEFASRISCFVAPKICKGKHDENNHFCLRRGLVTPAPIPCYVRKVVFRLKKLHDEALCHCGKLPHHVYSLNANWARWNPVVEEGQLLKEGWKLSWYNEKGKVLVHSGRKPIMFVWEILEKRKPKKDVKSVWRRS